MSSDGQNDANKTTYPTSSPLKVRDALVYLDAVKARFTDTPSKYNRFLDIMKEFKSGVIDTPGVMERASTLFRGHADLIEGFNTFLPPEYRVEYATEGTEMVVKMTTPSGVTTRRLGLDDNDNDNDLTAEEANKDDDKPLTADSSNSEIGSTDSREPLSEEYELAIQYVDRVKSRFQDKPEKYQQFVDILRLYRDGGEHEEHCDTDVTHAHEQAYSQIQVVFKDDPDLLAEFTDYIPRASSYVVAVKATVEMIMELEKEEEQSTKAKL